MRATSSKAASAVVHMTYISRAFYVALAATALLLLVPAPARAQNDAIRVMAGRVLDGVVNGDRVDPNGSIWRNDDIYRRDRDRDRAWERERAARERWCRQNRNDRRCDELFRNDRRNDRDNANWCWDRDRNGRCDYTANRNGRGRGPWWNDNDGWVPPGQRKKGR